MNKAVCGLFLILIICFTLTSCVEPAHTPLPVTPTTTASPLASPTPTLTNAPTLAPSPTPLAFVPLSPQWKGTSLKRVCTDQVVLDMAGGGASNAGYSQKQLPALLTELGLEPVDANADCDATLHIVATSALSQDQYQSLNGNQLVNCATGVGFHGLLVLARPGAPALSAVIDSQVANAPILSQGCPDEADAFATAYVRSILGGLDKILGPEVVTALFKSPDYIHRNAAFLATATFGPDDLSALPQVLAAMNSANGIDDQLALAGGIAALGPQAQQAAGEVVPRLVEQFQKMLSDPVSVQTELLSYLELFKRLGAGSKAAVPRLLELLAQNNGDDLTAQTQQYNILDALVGIGPGAAEAAPEMILLAKSDQLMAVRVLAAIGPAAPDALPVLWEIAKNKKSYPDSWSSGLAALAAFHAQDPAIVPFLESICQKQNKNDITAALAALDQINLPADDALPLITHLLTSSDLSIRLFALDSLKQRAPGLGERAREMIPLLTQMSHKVDTIFGEDVSALDALYVVAPDDPQTLQLIQAKLDRDRSLDEEILLHLGPQARQLVPGLIQAMKYLQNDENGGANYIIGLVPYFYALVNITGAYPGYKAADWQSWLDSQP